MLTWKVRDGVELRLPEERHAAELFRVVEANRHRLRDWLPWVPLTHSVDDILAFIRTSRREFERPERMNLLIFCDGHIAGSCGLRIDDRWHETAEIGYWISEEWMGKGIVTDCCRAVISYAFEDLNLSRIQILCAPGNERSRAIPKRLKFVYEGTLRQVERVGPRILDLECHALLRSEWSRW